MKDPNSKTVKVYDFKTKIFTTIPLVELAPGMIQASVNGETCWINPHTADLEESPFRHPPFDKTTRGNLRRIMGVFKEVRSLNLKQWEEGFRRDMHPQQQILAWLHMANVYEDITSQFELTLPQKTELFKILIICSTTEYEKISLVTSPQFLDANITDKAIQTFYGQPELRRQASLKPAVEYPDPSGNTPRPVENLRDLPEREKELEMLKAADVIFGVDSSTGQSGIFFGRPLLEKISATGEAMELRSLSYLYDSRTDQLELLVLAIIATKGKGMCDYPGTADL